MYNTLARIKKNDLLKNITTLFIILSTILLSWNFTLDPADPKILTIIFLSPFILLPIFARQRIHTIPHPKKKIILGPLVFFIFVIYVFSNWYLKSYPYYGNRALVYYWQCFIGFFLGVFVFSKKNLFTPVILSIIAVSVLSSLYAIAEYFGYIHPFEVIRYPQQVTGLIGHKNTFGFILLAAICWNCSLLLSAPVKKFTKDILLLSLSLVILFFALLVSDSRGSLALTILGIILIVIPFSIANGLIKKYSFRIGLYSCIFLLSIIPVLLWSDTFWIRFAQLFNNHSLPGPRNALFTAQWKLFLVHPLFGSGVGNFISLNIPFLPEWYKKTADPWGLFVNGHNDYFETLCELGLIGLSMYLFFLVGAIIKAIELIKKNKSQTYYTTLIILILLMIHASFSTASRHIPSSTLLWMIVGIFWQEPFQKTWDSFTLKSKQYTGILLITIHLIITGLFFQILLGDTLYISFLNKSRENQKPISLLQKAITICPFHPNALYRTAYISLERQEYDFTLICINQLDSVAPYILPTDVIRGICYFNKNDLSHALACADNALALRPTYIDAKLLRAKSLSKLGMCEELQKMKRIVQPRMITDTSIASTIPSENELLKKLFLEKTGFFRSKFSGPFLKKTFQYVYDNNKRKSADIKKQTDKILSLSCIE